MSDTLEIFTGFQISYPEYEIITPQTLNKYTIRSMNVSEEETLKGSFVSPRSIPGHINEIIWKCLVKKPKTITDYNSFLKKTTMMDRDALLYGLFHITYKDIQKYEIVCNKCKNQFSVSLDISKTFNINPYKGKTEEILGKIIPIELKLAKNITVEVFQPTLIDEKKMLDDPLFNSDENLKIGTEMLPVKQFVIWNPTTDKKDEKKERDNILIGYKSLPASDRKVVTKTYTENFGKYKIDLKMTVKCPKCSTTNDNDIDIMDNLFRTLFE